MKARLVLSIDELPAHGTGMPGQATAVPAGPAVDRGDVLGAAADVVAVGSQHPRWTGRQTRPRGAGIARTGPPFRHRKGQTLGHQNGAPVGVPKAVIGVDQRSDRRGKDGFRALGPALEGVVGRSLEGINRLPADRFRERCQHGPSPGIQRMADLLSLLPDEDRPHGRARVAGEDDRLGFASVA